MKQSIILIQNAFKTKAMHFAMGIGLLFLCSQMAIPLEPVPITLQTIAVMFIGLTYSRQMAVSTLAGYLSLGAMGFPVFSNFTGGLPVLMGPKAGYFFGWVLTVYVMASLREKYNKDSATFYMILSTIGTVIYMGLGVLWLSKFVGFDKALALGLYPFIIPGTLKAVFLSGALYGYKRWKKS